MTLVTDWMAGLPVLRSNNDYSAKLIVLQPLFEETNKFRRTLALILRCLDDMGINALVPDLPGMGEHPTGLDRVQLEDVRLSLRHLAEAAAHSGQLIGTASFRAACLFDGWTNTPACWRFAPEEGDKLVRTLMRTEDASESNETHAFVSGQYVRRPLLSELQDLRLSVSPMTRTVRLSTDRGDADLHIEGSPLWRHAEPGEDVGLAQSIAQDIASWSKTCASF